MNNPNKLVPVGSTKGAGGTLLGVFIGLVLGIVIALGVVLYPNKAALPFRTNMKVPANPLRSTSEWAGCRAAGIARQTRQCHPGKTALTYGHVGRKITSAEFCWSSSREFTYGESCTNQHTSRRRQLFPAAEALY